MAGSGGKGKTVERTPAKTTERDSFTDGGQERTMAESWVPARKGEAILGRLERVTDIRTKLSKGDETAPLAEFSPVVCRDEHGNKTAYGSLAVLLSANLRVRIKRASDVGKVFAIVYQGDVDAGRGNKMHDFTVVEQSQEKLVAELRALGADDDLPF